MDDTFFACVDFIKDDVEDVLCVVVLEVASRLLFSLSIDVIP